MLKIGWSTKDISTEAPVHIPGQMYARVSKGVLEPLMLSTLVVEGDTDCVIFMSCDTVCFVPGLLDTVKEKALALCPDIPADSIMLAGTHTHTSPDHSEDYPEEILLRDGVEIENPAVYRDFLTTQAATAAVEAYTGRKPGAIAYGYGYAVVAHSRRCLYLDDLSQRPGADNNNSFSVDGHARVYGPTNDPMFAGYEAGADHFTNMLYTFDMDGNLTGALINVPCPSQNSESRDYLTAGHWHEVRVMLKEKYGDIHILPQCGAGGDLCPGPQHYRKAMFRRYALKHADVVLDKRITDDTRIPGSFDYYNRLDIAERICQSFDEVLSWAKKDLRYDAPVGHTVRNVDLAALPVTEEEYNFCCMRLAVLSEIPLLKTENPEADLFHNSMSIIGRQRFRDVMKNYEEQQVHPGFPFEIHTARIGEISFATNPFELYMDYQHRIQGRSPFEQTCVIQLSAQPRTIDGRAVHACTYLGTERAMQNKGYGAISYSSDIGAEGGQQLVEATLEDLQKLYAKE